MRMFSALKFGAAVSAIGLAVLMPGQAAADDCYGDLIDLETNLRDPSECTDNETGAGVKAFIFSFSGTPPSQKPGALRVMLDDFDAAGASEWELYAWTFDEDGRVIEDCSAEAFSPFFEGIATDIQACNTAVGMLAYGLFTP